MKKYTIAGGKHDFKPSDSFALSNPLARDVSFRVKFGADCNYVLPGEDQNDWNKGGGFSFSLFSNTKEAIMWAWRWNPTLQRIQLCAYWHVKGQAFYAETQNDFPFAVALEQEFTVRIYKPGVFWHVMFQTIDGTKIIETSAQGRPIRPIGLWFGGNQPAPQAMTVFIEKLK